MSAPTDTVAGAAAASGAAASDAATLGLDALDALPDAVARPGYARADVSAGIVHFGPGNFHRAHQAVYLDRLMNEGDGLDWGIVGASVMPGDAALREAMLDQDCLTTVVSETATTSEARVTAPMVGYLPVGDADAILDALADPAIRIVSLTVTEGGYFVDATTGRFDDAHPAIRRDAESFDAPATVFGLIARALAARRETGAPAFTVMSCDNLPHNGAATRAAVTGLARLVDPGLADWIDARSAFPNGMVDRITPATGERERRRVREEFGVADAAPVFCEDYLQWVLEDRFANGRPALERVGVEIVPDVAPYETMKIRILNGGHAVIAYAAGLLDVEYAHEAMAHPLVSGFLDRVERTEILPTVPPVPGVDLEDYLATIARRFANPRIGDTIARLCFDGSNRQPKFIVPTVADRLAAGDPVDGLALVSALWCRYCEGRTEGGAEIRPNDPSWDRLVEVAAASRDDPGAWLDMADVYGETGRDERFRDAFANALRAVREDGVAAALERHVGAAG